MLSVFTLADRVELQFFLNQPIEAVEEGSYLWTLLYQVEQRDMRLGSTLAMTIKLEIAKVRALHDSISRSLEAGTGGAGVQSRDSALEGKEQYTTDMGELLSPQMAIDRYLSNIKLWLGMARRPQGNRLRTTFPGGHAQTSGKSPYAN